MASTEPEKASKFFHEQAWRTSALSRVGVGCCNGTKGEDIPLSPHHWTKINSLILHGIAKKLSAPQKATRRVEEVIITLEEICAMPKITTVS